MNAMIFKEIMKLFGWLHYWICLKKKQKIKKALFCFLNRLSCLNVFFFFVKFKQKWRIKFLKKESRSLK